MAMRSLKTYFLITFFLAVAILAGCQNNQMNQEKTTPVAHAAADDPLSIHKRAIAVDMHADTVQRVVDEHVDLQHQLADGQLDAVRAKGHSRRLASDQKKQKKHPETRAIGAFVGRRASRRAGRKDRGVDGSRR